MVSHGVSLPVAHAHDPPDGSRNTGCADNGDERPDSVPHPALGPCGLPHAHPSQTHAHYVGSSRVVALRPAMQLPRLSSRRVLPSCPFNRIGNMVTLVNSALFESSG